jgi:hypothetical protein
MTVEFITALFSEVDEQLRAIPTHPEAPLWPSEVVTLGLLHARKGGGNRAFSRWLTRDSRPLFPRLPERTRLFRLFNPSRPTRLLGRPDGPRVIDTYGIELDPSDARRPEPPADRPEIPNHRDCRRETVSLLNQWG